MHTKILKLFLLSSLLLFNSLPVFSQNTITPYLKVTSPNGGERWEAKSIHNITWESRNISEIKIEYSFNNGYSWFTLTNSFNAAAGKYIWTVPNSQTGDVLVRISSSSNPPVFDISDESFIIYIQRTVKKYQNLNKTATVSSTAVRIMPLGDSITAGEGDDPNWDQTLANFIAVVGWRERLFNLLSGAGYNFRFVGNRVSGYDDEVSGDPNYGTPFYNVGRYNEGHGGWVADGTFSPGKGSIEDNLNGWLNTLKSNIPSDEPEVILLMAGTNDLNSSDVASTIEGDILRNTQRHKNF